MNRTPRSLSVSRPTIRTKSSGPLTSRESEVVRLVAEGLSNEQIANRLYLSKRTVEHHVGNILGKLDLTSRAQLSAYAIRRGLAGGESPARQRD